MSHQSQHGAHHCCLSDELHETCNAQMDYRDGGNAPPHGLRVCADSCSESPQSQTAQNCIEEKIPNTKDDDCSSNCCISHPPDCLECCDGSVPSACCVSNTPQITRLCCDTTCHESTPPKELAAQTELDSCCFHHEDSCHDLNTKPYETHNTSPVPSPLDHNHLDECCVIRQRCPNVHHVPEHPSQMSRSRRLFGTAYSTAIHMRRRPRHSHYRSRQSKPCCGASEREPPTLKRRLMKIPSFSPVPERHADIEKGTGERYRLVLAIQGMDCSSCFTRVSRALESIPTVELESKDLMAGRATVRYDTAFTDSDRIVDAILKQSGFVCHVNFDGKPGERMIKVRSEMPIRECDVTEFKGVTRVRPEGKNIFSISFEPELVRARDVLESLAPWNATLIHSNDTDNPGELRPIIVRAAISAFLSVPVLVLAWAHLPSRSTLYGALSLALTTPIQWGCALYIHKRAIRILVKQRSMEMDFLVTLSTTTAYVYSVVAFGLQVAGIHISNTFFETTALLVTLILIGRLVSAWSRRRATSALRALQQLVPDTAVVIGPDGEAAELSVSLIECGDVVRVPSHTRIPLDGKVIAGQSEADEASLTGESIPVSKRVGDNVYAGSLNVSGPLDIRVSTIVGDSTVSNIAMLMREAQTSRVPLQDEADRFASWLTPIALGAAIASFIAWIFCGIVIQKLGSSAIPRAITYSISVLVVSCPCALALAVPLVFVIATTIASKRGLLIKDAAVLQVAQSIDTIVFDKTGTITLGKLRVVDVWTDPEIQNLGATVLALTKGDKHPIAIAIAEHLRVKLASDRKMAQQAPKFRSLRSIPGCGLQAELPDGTILRGGSPAWLNCAAHRDVSRMQQDARTLFCVVRSAQLIAVFGLTDQLRLGMRRGMRALLKRGLDVHVVSGDRSEVVRSTAAELQLPASCTVLGEQSVKDKVAHIVALQHAGRHVLFCGDGTNDGPALAQADIGVSLASGTDLATSAAQIVLMSTRPDLAKCILGLIHLSASSMVRVRLNFIWCIIYNAFAITLAGGLFITIRIPPAFAGLGELISVLPVVLIAFTMYFHRFN